MPVAVFNSGVITTTFEGAARELIPGVTPGGQFAGKRKPALLIKDAWVRWIDFANTGVAEDFSLPRVSLKLSQERDLTPGFLLHVESVHMAKTGTAQLWNSIVPENEFRSEGTIWAPRVVGLRVGMGGNTSLQVLVFLSYERIFLPWRDWFVHWEFLDGVVDNDEGY